MALLFPTAPIFGLPFTKGDDLYFVFVYKPLVTDVDGEPVLDAAGKKQYAEAPYPNGSTVVLAVDADTPLTVDGVITGSRATFHDDFLVADEVAKNKLWRIVLTFSDGRNKVLCNGTTLRSDGQPPT